MKYSIALAAFAAAASAHHNVTEPELVTSTVYATHLFTITSCAPVVTDCPADSTVIKTVTVPAYTTVCPATETHKAPVYTPSTHAVPVYSSSVPYVKPTTPVYTKPVETHVYSSTSNAAVPQPPATHTPYKPGPGPNVPKYTTSAAAVPNPPVGTATQPGTIGTGVPTYTASKPIATGAAPKVAAGSLGGLAVAAVAMLL